MIYGLYLSAAGMQAQEMRQDMIANNMANSQTTGFKADLMEIQARANAVDEDPRLGQYRMPVFENQGGGVSAFGGGVDLTQGSLKSTNNATDVALDGKGFFVVQGAKADEQALTRDGQFILNSDGALVMATSGRPVLSSNGQPIQLNPDLPVNITSQGFISQGDGTGVQLGLKDVTDARRLIKLGGNLMTTDKPEALKDIDPGTQVRQGNLESSGVDPIHEMVNMMEGLRAFEANTKMITVQDTTLSQLNTVGRVA